MNSLTGVDPECRCHYDTLANAIKMSERQAKRIIKNLREWGYLLARREVIDLRQTIIYTINLTPSASLVGPGRREVGQQIKQIQQINTAHARNGEQSVMSVTLQGVMGDTLQSDMGVTLLFLIERRENIEEGIKNENEEEETAFRRLEQLHKLFIERYPPRIFNMWIRGQRVEIDGEDVFWIADTSFKYEWVAKHYKAEFLECQVNIAGPTFVLPEKVLVER